MSNNKIILNALEEDKGKIGDITSNAIFKNATKHTFDLVVNENAVLSGLNVFEDTYKCIDNNIHVKLKFANGAVINKGSIIASVYGSVTSILLAERVSLNFIAHLSGIATLTHELVNLIKHTKVTLLDTRKTTPNMRAFEKEAIVSGGGSPHRASLSDMVLIKDNHIAACGGIIKAVALVREAYKDKYRIEVEVSNLHELNEAIEAKPDIIMFDNWNAKDLKEALNLLPKTIQTEASGEITKENIKAYAECGVNYISTSYMVKNAKWIDFSLKAVG